MTNRGLRFDTKEYIYKAAIGMMFKDALSDMYHSTVIREKQKGATQAVWIKYLDAVYERHDSLNPKTGATRCA